MQKKDDLQRVRDPMSGAGYIHFFTMYQQSFDNHIQLQ